MAIESVDPRPYILAELSTDPRPNRDSGLPEPPELFREVEDEQQPYQKHLLIVAIGDRAYLTLNRWWRPGEHPGGPCPGGCSLTDLGDDLEACWTKLR